MKLTVTSTSGDIFTLEVTDDIELENFKAYCEVESGIPANEITLLYEGRNLTDEKKSLRDYSVKDGDMLLLQRHGSAFNATGTTPNLDFSSIHVPRSLHGVAHSPSSTARGHAAGGGSSTIPGLPADLHTLREMLLSSPYERSLLKERNPELAAALLSDSFERFEEVLRRQQHEKDSRDRERLRVFQGNLLDLDVQQRIADEIRQENINANMETAMEYAPESFGQVHMLYIDCRVNGHEVKAFVDSGAQMTIMSQQCAKRCHIERLVDSRWAGIAKGVGTQKIIGRVHLCEIQVAKSFLPCSFAILEDQPMDMLLGLDMLKRYQCCIDLKKNILVIGTTLTSTPFLSEGELPEMARLNHSAAEEDGNLEEALATSSAASREGRASTSRGGGSGELSSATATSQKKTSYPEATIKRITDCGFARSLALTELERCDGDADKALIALLAKALPAPSMVQRRP